MRGTSFPAMLPASVPQGGFERAFTRRVEEFAQQLRTEFQSEIDRRISSETQALGEMLNQACRRIRLAESAEEILSALAVATAPFCDRAGVFQVIGQNIRGTAVRGVEDEGRRKRFADLELPFAQALGLLGAVRGSDPLILVASENEVSAAVVEIFGHVPEERVAVFPVVVGKIAAALLYAVSATSPLAVASLELLATSAGMALDLCRALTSHEERLSAPPGLVSISGTQGAGKPAAPAPVWANLSRAEQELHLRAQRFARVEVAEIRLYQPEAVIRGRKERTLYRALCGPIDEARAAFQKQFLNTLPSMIDYLHLELVTSLAHDDASLLGPDYPGPLV